MSDQPEAHGDLPSAYREMARSFPPTYWYANNLREMLLRYFHNPRDQRNVLARRIVNNLMELRYLLDKSLCDEMMDDDFDCSFLH